MRAASFSNVKLTYYLYACKYRIVNAFWITLYCIKAAVNADTNKKSAVSALKMNVARTAFYGMNNYLVYKFNNGRIIIRGGKNICFVFRYIVRFTFFNIANFAAKAFKVLSKKRLIIFHKS